MNGLNRIANLYSEHDIKAILFSMTDTMYDLLYNPGSCTWVCNEDVRYATEQLRQQNWYDTDERLIRIIHKCMDYDMSLNFPSKNHYDDHYALVNAFIKRWGAHCLKCVRGYNADKVLNQGRLVPDVVGTNGCKAAYLFVHDRHPKHKLNKYVNQLLVPVVTREIFVAPETI